MTKVTHELKVSLDDDWKNCTTLSVESHWNENELAWLIVGTLKVLVRISDLEKALRNARNV